MSYLVLARKYRPKSFAQMVGQEHVVQALSNALRSQRLHHAYLFTGTRGVGKTTVARILAKSLNCVGPDGRGDITDTPCGQCQVCLDIDAGRFIDYTELDAASNRGVSEVQALLEQAVYKPVQGRFKVFMIDEVHMLSNTAFNAMLKTLEEPPDYLKFILATTDPQKVPVTVLSRCLQFSLRPMAPQTVQDHLVQVLRSEGITAQASALRLLSRAAHGSMRDALSLTDQAIAFGAGTVSEDTVRGMLGSVDKTYVHRLIDALSQGDGRRVIATCEALRLHGLSAASTLEEMASALQRMAVLRTAPEMADADDPDDAALAALATQLAADENQLLYSICLHGRAELALAPDDYAGLTMVLLRLLAFKPTPEATGTPARSISPPPSEPVAVRAASAPQQAPAVAPAQWVAIPVRAQSEPSARTEPRVSAEEIARPQESPQASLWHGVVQSLIDAQSVAAMVRELALQSQLMACDGDTWTLRVERESLAQAVHRDKLQAALQAAGHAVQLVLEQGPVHDSPARRLAAAQDERQRQAEQQIVSDPFVQAMMRDFGAKIVPGSIRAI